MRAGLVKEGPDMGLADRESKVILRGSPDDEEDFGWEEDLDDDVDDDEELEEDVEDDDIEVEDEAGNDELDWAITHEDKDDDWE
jgi:hypothetical protein